MMTKTKTCTKCKQTLPISEFRHRSSKKQNNFYVSHCKECENKKNRDNYWKNVEKHKSSYLQRTYGITLEESLAILEKQNNACAICKSPEPNTKKGWHLDHNHKTGRVRGMLCHHCNLLIGNAKDNIETLKESIAYLIREEEDGD